MRDSPPSETLRFRREVLAEFGATATEMDELLEYNENVFQIGENALPLPDEPFVEAWEGYLALAAARGVWEVLREKLIELCFPIEAGISETEDYRAAKRRGVIPTRLAPGLQLQVPESLQLSLHSTAVGRIPIIVTPNREDFLALVRALLRRNEPVPLPGSVGAYMVSGYNNWDRVRHLKSQWETTHPGAAEADWPEAFRALIPQKELYQDRFILLSSGPYSDVSAGDLGLDEETWSHHSLVIRREHECTHYFTRRLFGSARNNLLDELLADFAGLKAAFGEFRAGWFLRFLGLEDPGNFRSSGRLASYRGQPPLSEKAFGVVQRLIAAAARNLQKLDAPQPPKNGPLHSARTLAACASLTLEELASRYAIELIEAGRRRLENQITGEMGR